MSLQKNFLLFFIFFSLATLVIAAVRISPLEHFPFSNKDELNAWEEKILNGKVSYWIEHNEAEAFLHAKSQATCSAIYHKVWFSPSDYPILSWKWNVVEFPKKGPDSIKVDDFPARLYVIFPGISFGTSKFLEYTWDEFIPEEKILDGLTPNIKVIVVHSGDKSHADEPWVVERRNIIKDYLKAFRKRPRQKIGAIALMCDADTTKSSAESYFDDIIIDYRK